MSEAEIKNLIKITLPDGSEREFNAPITAAMIAADIGPGLEKAALAVKIDGRLLDLSTTISESASIEIITLNSDDDTVYDLIRHDAAHVMAEAVQELFPNTQITFGPAIENGFYYDFVRETPFTSHDLEKIETRMKEIVKRDETISRETWNRSEAIEFFTNAGEIYKAEHIGTLPEDTEISVYRQGEWLDLCAGPHLPSTAKLGSAFKLMKVSGAYWRGDPTKQQLQRIYGTAWRNSKELKTYLTRLEEAEKRDHRRLGREMDLFHIQEEAVGSVFWHPKGWTLYRICEQYMRERLEDSGYSEVKTPQLVDRGLWEKSGHWEKFRENMFTINDDEDRVLAVKPMNCPCHVQIYKQGTTSYRDLPIRMAEFGSCHRYEPSGALHGIMRVRAFTQDDAHIFCTEDQIVSETKSFCDLLLLIYRDFGFTEVQVKFADRPEIRAGDDMTWDRAEQALIKATDNAGLDYSSNPGEGAFYGPKLEFVLKDTIGREWQCGTLQVDFVLPERLDASYIGEDGNKHRPVMLHRAILGSFERFIGILIEHYAGRFPLWLSPVQAVITTITNDADEYAKKVETACINAGLRVVKDTRSEKINYKIREHSLAHVPVIIVVGQREAESETVNIRRLGSKDQEILALTDAVSQLIDEGRSPSVR
ncbi:MAG: Threonine--tRNA ligase [Alphaproteobacteria bacterium MarineAlpha12_Bin1]|jgi:threonyl-tRNA synthetase|nr:MAG: Threonine--tRNA ligase [Alphaproteobacteria bacterium MarineAlpha12_Bin1]|tara:strand:- start:8916 stop:10865 length:1950 start_codon:yes stop_codon:yes gene_type:complete